MLVAGLAANAALVTYSQYENTDLVSVGLWWAMIILPSIASAERPTFLLKRCIGTGGETTQGAIV